MIQRLRPKTRLGGRAEVVPCVASDGVKPVTRRHTTLGVTIEERKTDVEDTVRDPPFIVLPTVTVSLVEYVHTPSNFGQTLNPFTPTSL